MAGEARAILAKMRATRRAVCADLHALLESHMTAATTWARGEADVRFMFLRYADHEEEHALQIAAMLDAFGFRQSKAQRILGAAEVTHGDLLASLVGLNDDDLDRAPAGEWPLRRTLAHVINVEHSYTANTLHAVSRFRDGLPWNPAPASAMPPDLDDVLDGTMASFTERLDAARERVLTELSGLPDEVLVAPTRWNNRDVSVEFRLMRFAHHEREHTAHILKWRQQVDRTPTEAEHLLGLGWRARGVTESLLVGLPDDMLDRESTQDGATIRGLLTHIMDSERYITGQIQGAI